MRDRAALFIDPSGTVIDLRQRRCLEEHESVTSKSSFHDIRDPFLGQRSNKATKATDISSWPSQATRPPGKAIKSRQKNKKPISLSSINKSQPAKTSNQSDRNILVKRSEEVAWTGPVHTIDEERKPSPSPRSRPKRPCPFKNRPWNKRLARGDSDNTASTFRSLGTHASMLDKYAFMSYRFPITTKTEKVVMAKGSKTRDVTIETIQGETIGFIDYSLIKRCSTRVLKDVTGKPCAVLHHKRSEKNGGYPTFTFRVYGDKPSTFGQEPTTKDKSVRGLYLWAEINNTGSLGGKFVMKRFGSKTSSCCAEEYCARKFGSLFSKNKSKGFNVLNSKDQECVKMVSLKDRRKGIVIAPNQDVCLMLAFCAVVAEMAENRMR